MPLPPTTAISQEDTNAGDNQENITTNARDKQENITMTDAGVYVNVCTAWGGFGTLGVNFGRPGLLWTPQMAQWKQT